MNKIENRYFFSQTPLSDVSQKYMLRNLKYNKGVDLTDDQTEHETLCEITAEIVRLHRSIQTKESSDCLYEINNQDLTILRHPIYTKADLPDWLYKENKVSKTIRVKENVDTEQIKSQLFDNKYGTFFNIYKDISSKEYAMVGVEFKPSPFFEDSETGFGRAETFKKAESQAILEALERYGIYNLENYSMKQRLNKVITDHAQRKELAAYLDKEFLTVEVEELGSKQKVWQPEQFFKFLVNDPEIMVNETSNGVALGSSYYEAALYSLFEFIERDAFLTFWHKQVPLRQIDKKSLNGKQKKIIEEFEAENKHVYLFDMRFDIDVPTILSLVISKNEKPATYVSAAAHLNYEVAIEGALKEAIVAHNVYKSNSAVGKKEYATKAEVLSLSDHFNYYSKPEAIGVYDFLFESNELFSVENLFKKDTVETDKEALDKVVDKMKGIGSIYCCDIKNELINHLGFIVTKVIIPNMQTMYFGYKNKRINQQRIDQAVIASSYKNTARIKEGGHFDKPHPFP